jgi:hypothetical protein
MKKLFGLTAAGVAVAAVSLAAWAADISNLSGQSCGEFTGTWHFVNNQVPAGSGTGTLAAAWSSGNTCTVSASTVNKNTQHFYCTAAGTLLSASTNLGGRLVLSDFTCGTKEPPPCDPTKDPTCK